VYSDRIKELRTKRGMTRQELATYMEVSSTAVYKWETAQSQPDIPALQKLADLFGVTLDSICDYRREEEESNAGEESKLALMTRAFRQLSPDEQEKMLAVGRAMFGSPFPKAKE